MSVTRTVRRVRTATTWESRTPSWSRPTASVHPQMTQRPPTSIPNKGFSEHAVHFNVGEVKGRPYRCYECHISFGTSEAARQVELQQGHDLRLCYQCHGAVTQNVVLDQQQPAKLAIEGWSKAEAVDGSRSGEYSLYVDLLHQDGSPLWGQTAQFDTGTHDWQFSRTIIAPDKPIKSANVHMLLRGKRGTVWMRDVRFGVVPDSAAWNAANP